MTTNLFISWSGPLSQKIAGAIHEWIPSVLQSVDPFLSSEDIEKGTRWSDHIASKLEECGFGLIILTAENLIAPWIMFEAGALSKMVGKSNVAPLLINIQVAKVRPPLSQFQATRLEEDDFLKLVRSINRAGDNPVKDDVLEKTFRALWPEFKSDVDKLIAGTVIDNAPRPEEDQIDIKSLGLSVGDLIKSVQMLRDEVRSNVPSDNRELLEATLHEIRVSRANSPRVATGAVRDLDRICEILDDAINNSKSSRVILSKEMSDEIQKKAARVNKHIKRLTEMEIPYRFRSVSAIAS